MKGFYERKYPVTIEVIVTFNNAWCFKEKIKGLNVGHALWEARQNWDGAKIELV